MSNLYDRYRRWLKISKDSLADATFDDAALDAAAFNAQQSLEFLIKYILDCKNIEYKKTYDIDNILRLLLDTGFDFDLRDKALLMADKITKWESESRYGSGVSTVKMSIEECHDIIDSIDSAWIKENTKDTDKKQNKSVLSLLKDAEG